MPKSFHEARPMEVTDVPSTTMKSLIEAAKLSREFDTGATRDLDDSKFDFEAFLSPYVLDAYAAYMHDKRKMPDGTLRDGDNWQKGIPLDSYMKSGFRHFIDWWGNHRQAAGVPNEDLETALCALLFNINGYLHEIVKARRTNS